MTRSCGTCTLCCKLLGVAELSKLPGAWCKHVCQGKGCGIYDQRPATCRSFECLWLASARAPAPMQPLDEALQPNKSKVVLAFTENDDILHAWVDPAYPHAWKEGLMGQYLKVVGQRVRVLISHKPGTRKLLLEPALGGAAREIVMSEPDAEGRQHYKPEDQT